MLICIFWINQMILNDFVHESGPKYISVLTLMHTVETTALQSILHLKECTCAIESFILVHCLRYFSPEIITDTLYSY